MERRADRRNYSSCPPYWSRIMNYAKIKHFDPANGEGIRLSLFVSGCQFNCPGCFNQEAQDYNYGKPFTKETYNQILTDLSRPEYDGLSILGGDPLWQDTDGLNQLINLCKDTHSLNKNIWLWTGFTFESIFNPVYSNTDFIFCQELIKNCDVVVDGLFKEKLRDLSLKWRGSSNQRIIDVKKTLEAKEVILKEN